MRAPPTHTYGVILVTVAATLWSTAGFFVRLLDLDVWTILAWRSVFTALSLALFVVFQNGRRTVKSIRAIGWPGIAAVPIAAVAMGCFVLALKLTTVANVMIVYATVPFVAAAVAYCWIGETLNGRFLLASAVALLGILTVAGFAARLQDAAGSAVAFLMTLAFGVQLVMARRYPSLEMAPVNAFGAALCAILCWPFIAAGIPGVRELAILALFGITNGALGYILFLTGGRHIPSGEAGLIGLIDVVLGPLWVWLAFRERPGGAALVGGILVLAPVIWYLSSAPQRRIAARHRPTDNGVVHDVRKSG